MIKENVIDENEMNNTLNWCHETIIKLSHAMSLAVEKLKNRYEDPWEIFPESNREKRRR